MFASSYLAAALPGALPSSLRFGRLRIPVFGLFATAGLIAALALSQKTARKVGLSAEKLWDAGMFAIIAAFVASRVLLIVENFHAFRAVPLLVLELPSLTYGGVLITIIATLLYLRWKGLPLLRVLDAWAPSALLLAAFLQLGHFFEGTDAGMPTSLPWGVIAPGDTVLGHTHPVQLYAVVLALILMAVLMRWLAKRHFTGEAAAIALLAGGAGAFLLDMLRQPFDSYSPLPLEASQFADIAAMLAGIALIGFAPRRAPAAKPATEMEIR